MDKEKFLIEAKKKIKGTPDVDIQIMYVWLEGYMSGIGLDDTQTFMEGSSILRSLFK